MSGSGDRTEAPTPKRRREARRDGRVARAPDLATWLSVLLASYIVPREIGRAGSVLRRGLGASATLPARPDMADALRVAHATVVDTALVLLPLLLTVVAVVTLSGLAQVGLVATLHGMKPRFERVHPGKNLRQLVSARNLWETGKAVAKVAIVAAVGGPRIQTTVRELIAGGSLELGSALPFLASEVLGFVRVCAQIALLFALVDYGVAKRRVMRQLKMTKQEVRDEVRSAEGDPAVRAQQRSVRLRLARSRMMADVPRADVVVVNPTHVAVALRYERGQGVPQVVAKGAGVLALRIRTLAADADVPVVEARPVARALYRACEVGDRIPPELFEAVANILAFVYRLRSPRSQCSPVGATVRSSASCAAYSSSNTARSSSAGSPKRSA